MQNLKRTIYYLLPVIFFLLVFSQANPIVSQTDDSDTIAIRVIPNPEHWSARRWYIEQNFGGSPQSLTVDGYEAIRDGRTVYVNAGNISGTELWTNIYLISYNQTASSLTQDIFSQILNNWKFNTNLTGTGNCSKASDKACLIDSDCPAGEYCNSPKARAIHDVRRMADLSDIETALKEYYVQNNNYPKLQGGTYLKGISLSVWPSWQKILGAELGIRVPIDPVNKMGNCAGYHVVTCWDEASKSFDGAPPSVMPSGSRVYAYQSGDGEYELCAQMETGYSNIGVYECFDDSAANNPPEIISDSWPLAVIGEEYRGFVRARDSDGDALSWAYSASGFAGWSNAPIMEGSSDPDQKRFYASAAGGTGGTVNVTVTDSRGASVSASYAVAVSAASDKPVISGIGAQSVIIGNSLDFIINAAEAGGEYPLIYEFSGAPHGLNANGYLDADGHTLHVSGEIIDRTGLYNISVIARDSAGDISDPAVFTVTVVNNPPSITSSPVTSAVGCEEYEYRVLAGDGDGHELTFTVEGLPPGLSFDSESGVISGKPLTPSASGPFAIKITVKDQYLDLTDPAAKARDVQEFNLNISDESFSVTAPGDEIVYVTPLVPPLDYVPVLYHAPVSPFSHYANKSTPNEAVWSVVTSPLVLQDDAYAVIDVDGEIHVGAFKNSAFSASGYSFGVTVTATTNFCGVSASNNYNITIYPNEWCGDGSVQSDFGEECDDGRDGDNLDQCLDSCKITFCGDGYVQTPNGNGVNEECDDGNHISGDGCDAGCVKEGCGDGVIQAGEECDLTDLGGNFCTDFGFTGGPPASVLKCDNNCKFNTTGCCDKIDAGWSAWSGWSDVAGFSDGAGGTCSAFCDSGTQSRTHTCDNPMPFCGGADCSGLGTETQACNTTPCCNNGYIVGEEICTSTPAGGNCVIPDRSYYVEDTCRRAHVDHAEGMPGYIRATGNPWDIYMQENCNTSCSGDGCTKMEIWLKKKGESFNSIHIIATCMHNNHVWINLVAGTYTFQTREPHITFFTVDSMGSETAGISVPVDTMFERMEWYAPHDFRTSCNGDHKDLEIRRLGFNCVSEY